MRIISTIAGLCGLGLGLGCGGLPPGDAGTETEGGGATGTETAPGEASTAPGSTGAADETGTSDASSSHSSESTDTGSTTGAGCEPASPPGEGVVVTDQGPLLGVDDEGVTAFLGVPYAAPPTGALRFAPPQAPACEPEVRVVDTLGPRCPQLESPDGPVLGEEDCLYLNLWTPEASPARARPVMVFIHGGGHTIGYSGEALYDGANLAREHDVVMVTINYRLGALGYLSHDGLAAADPRGVSGNYGLLDQLEALRWVQRNIAGFGGDPGQVTVFGESAGAASTCALLGAPEVEGLVHGALLQSGGCNQRSAMQFQEAVGNPWVAASPCAAAEDLPACLRTMTVEEVLTNEPTGYPSLSALGQTWSPQVDGVVLPASTIDAMAAGEHVDVPLVVGANAEETANDVGTLSQEDYENLIQATFGALAGPVQGQYPVEDYASPTEAWVALTSDFKFVCGARRSAAAAAGGGRSPVYRYHFTYDGYTTAGADPAAFHGLELFYVFGNFDALMFGPFQYMPNAEDLELAALLGEAWTSFARTGDPSAAGLEWPEYAVETDPYAGLDIPPVSGAGVRTTQCDFWDAVFGG